MINERDLANIVLSGLKTNIREKLEGHEFLTINQVLQRALAQEGWSKELKYVHRYKVDRPKMNMVEYTSDDSDDEADVYAAEFVWPSKTKPFACLDLKPIHKNREGEMKFTLMLLSVTEFLMLCYKLKLSRCLILYHRLKS